MAKIATQEEINALKRGDKITWIDSRWYGERFNLAKGLGYNRLSGTYLSQTVPNEINVLVTFGNVDVTPNKTTMRVSYEDVLSEKCAWNEC